MKKLILVLLLCGSASAEVVREIGGLITKDNVNSRVGINLASGTDPAYTLDVVGGINYTGALTGSGTSLTGVVLKAGDTMTGQLTLSGSSLTINGNIGGYNTFPGTVTVSGNAFSVGGSTLVVSAGNIGIGVAAPTYHLQIDKLRDSTWMAPIFAQSSDMTAADHVGMFLGRTYSNGNAGYISFVYDGDDAATNRLSFGLHSSDDLMVITNPGRVGIGTTTPDSKLHISSGTLKLDGTGALFNISVSSTITTATDTCVKGDIRWDSSFIFVCVNTNAWERTALASW